MSDRRSVSGNRKSSGSALSTLGGVASDLVSTVRDRKADSYEDQRRRSRESLREELGRPRKRRKKKKNPFHLLLFPVVCIYYECLLRIFGGTGFFRALGYPVWFALGFGLFLAGLTSLLRRKSNRRLTIVVLFLLALFYTVECMVHESFQMYMTWKQIFTGTKDVMTGYSSDLIKAIFGGLPKIILFFWPWVLYVARGRRRLPARKMHPTFVGMLMVVSLVMGLAGSLVAAHAGNRDTYGASYEFDTATSVFGLLTSTKLDCKYALFGNRAASRFNTAVVEEETETAAEGEGENGGNAENAPVAEMVYGDNAMDLNFIALAGSESNDKVKELDTYASTITPSKKNAYTGLFQGKNLILICAEAYSDAFIDPALTPTLYRMTHNGFYFSDYYQPTWGGSTSTGEFSFVFGLAPQDGIESILETKENNNYFTMGNQLQRLNYWSCAYHNGTYNYYDRNLTHTNLGYDNFLAQGNGLEDICGRYPTDTTMFDKTMDVYMEHQPFSIYYMTVSGHAPYNDNESPYVKKYMDQVKSFFGDKYKKTTMNYICYQMELESALTRMIEKLEEKGIANDTVIALTADHYPYGLRKSHSWGNAENFVEDLYGHSDSLDWDRDENGLIIWSGCLENEYKNMAVEISTPVYSLDILPTLSNLFGLEYDSRLLVGRDVFSDQDPLVFWNDYSWVTERGKYNGKEKIYTPNGGYTEDDEYVQQINTIVKNKILFSDEVINTDYYGKLFGSDE